MLYIIQSINNFTLLRLQINCKFDKIEMSNLPRQSQFLIEYFLILLMKVIMFSFALDYLQKWVDNCYFCLRFLQMLNEPLTFIFSMDDNVLIKDEVCKSIRINWARCDFQEKFMIIIDNNVVWISPMDVKDQDTWRYMGTQIHAGVS